MPLKLPLEVLLLDAIAVVAGEVITADNFVLAPGLHFASLSSQHIDAFCAALGLSPMSINGMHCL